jgi:hypothetical protein
VDVGLLSPPFDGSIGVVGRLGLAMDLHSSQKSLRPRDVRRQRFSSRQYYHNSSLSKFEHLAESVVFQYTPIQARSPYLPVLQFSAMWPTFSSSSGSIVTPQMLPQTRSVEKIG